MPNKKDYQDYYVTIKIDARAVVPVRAISYEEAMQKAKDDFIDLNLNEIEIVESDVILVEDEDGNYAYEK